MVKKGDIPWNKGKTGVYSKTTLKKMSKKKSEEHKRKLSDSAKLRFKNPTNHPMFGKKHSEETKAKFRKRVITEKTRKKISKTKKIQMKDPKNHPLYGKKHSAASKSKMRAAQLGKKASVKTKRKMSLSHKGKQVGKLNGMFGKKHSEETRGKMSKDRKGSLHPLYGKKHSAASKSKMRAARLHQVMPLKDTKPERILQKLLKTKKIPFIKHKPILGQPDIFIKPNICIFVDGDYWHANPKKYKRDGKEESGFKGKPNKILAGKLKVGDVWKRDKKVNQTLKANNYKVLRFWHSELENTPEKCIKKILKKIQKR